MTNTKMRCGFAVVFLKPTGERRVFRCRAVSPEPWHVTHIIRYSKGRYDGDLNIINAEPDWQRSASELGCKAGITIETDNKVDSWYCHLAREHSGFHQPRFRSQASAWQGAIYLVYRDYEAKLLDRALGINYALGAMPPNEHHPLPPYTKPKVLPEPEPTPETLRQEAMDRIERRARDFVEAVEAYRMQDSAAVFDPATAVMLKLKQSMGWKWRKET